MTHEGRRREHGLRPAPTLRLAALVVAIGIAGLVAGAALAGCGGKQTAEPMPMLEIAIVSEDTTNSGRPFYVLVRTVTPEVFRETTYQEAVGLVTAPDASIVANLVVFPGRDAAVTIETPDAGDLAIYLMLTEPDSRWRRFFERPLPERIVIDAVQDSDGVID